MRFSAAAAACNGRSKLNTLRVKTFKNDDHHCRRSSKEQEEKSHHFVKAFEGLRKKALPEATKAAWCINYVIKISSSL